MDSKRRGLISLLLRHAIFLIALLGSGPVVQAADVVGAAAPAHSPADTPAQAPKSALILIGGQQGLPMSDTVVSEIIETLRRNGLSVRNLYVESLDLIRDPSQEKRLALSRLLRLKFAAVQIGIVVAVNQPALDFLASEGSDILPPDVPVLSTFVQHSMVQWPTGPRRQLNIGDRFDVAGTLRAGLKLFPSTRRLVVVQSPIDAISPFARQADGEIASIGL